MSPRTRKHKIEIVHPPAELPVADLRGMAEAALERLRDEPVELTFAFTSDEDIRDLNNRFRGLDEPTDVLSFPIDEETPEGRWYLGDIVISLPTARRQAQNFGHDLRTELLQLALHGLLHLCGYDHEEDDGEMDARELSLRDEILQRYC